MTDVSELFRDQTVVDVRAKCLYMSIPRVANTAIKTAFFSSLERPDEGLMRTDWPHPTRDLAIHHRANFAGFTLADFPEEQVSAMLSSPEWLRVAVVRHPLERVWSAWQLLVLLEDPHLSAMGRGLTSHVSLQRATWEEFSQLFDDFLKSSAFRELVISDIHFMPQSLIMRELRHCVKVFKLDELDHFESLIKRRYEQHGLRWVGIDRRNESFFGKEMISISTIAAASVNDAYSHDLESFDFEPVSPRLGFASQQSIFKLSLHAAHEIRERNRRLWLIYRALEEARAATNGRDLV